MDARERVTGLSLEWGESGVESFEWEGSTTPYCSTGPLHILRFPENKCCQWLDFASEQVGNHAWGPVIAAILQPCVQVAEEDQEKKGQG